MEKMLIEVRHFMAALALARHRHFQKAASELGTTQPALSRVIRALEEELGECLFNRGRGRVELTPVGEQFIGIARDLLNLRETKLKDLQALISARRGLVALACLPSLAESLALMTGRFCASRPQITTRLLESAADHVLDSVRSGAADLGLGLLSGGEPDIIASPYLTDALMAVGAARNPLMSRENLQWNDLTKSRIIWVSRDSNTRRGVERAFAQCGANFHPAMEVTLMSTAESLAAANMGVAILPSSFTNNIRGKNPLVRPLIPEVNREIFLFRRKDHHLLPAALEMESFLLENRPDHSPRSPRADQN